MPSSLQRGVLAAVEFTLATWDTRTLASRPGIASQNIPVSCLGCCAQSLNSQEFQLLAFSPRDSVLLPLVPRTSLLVNRDKGLFRASVSGLKSTRGRALAVARAGVFDSG